MTRELIALTITHTLGVARADQHPHVPASVTLSIEEWNEILKALRPEAEAIKRYNMKTTIEEDEDGDPRSVLLIEEAPDGLWVMYQDVSLPQKRSSSDV